MNVLIALNFIVVVATCNNGSSAVINYTSISASSLLAVQKDTMPIAGYWILVPVLPSDTAGGKIPFLNFSLVDNKFSGNNGCNNISGSFKLKDDEMKFGDQIISTKMACTGYNEKIFMDNLLKVNRFEFQNGMLTLMYNTTPLSKWERRTDTSSVKGI